jgi:hypothetical protein
MLAEPIRWSHARGNPVVPSLWQMTVRGLDLALRGGGIDGA